jgi:hypothetical protein
MTDGGSTPDHHTTDKLALDDIKERFDPEVQVAVAVRVMKDNNISRMYLNMAPATRALFLSKVLGMEDVVDRLGDQPE